MRPHARNLIWIVPLAIIGMVVFVFLGGHLVKFLWNWLLPPLFGFPAIGFWQAVGLVALGRILFGGVGLAGRGGPRSRRRMREQFEFMTPEEKEEFRQRMRRRWGLAPDVPPSSGE